MDNEIPARMELKRPFTVYFPMRNIDKLNESEVAEGLKAAIDLKEVKAIQLTFKECRVTLTSMEAKQKLKAAGLNVRNMYYRVQDADKPVMNVTVKDAPFEMDDVVIATALARFGSVVQGSIKRGTVRGTEIQNGTRYLHMINIQEDIPRQIQIGRFQIRVICDRNIKAVRKCFRCYSTEHLVGECPEAEMVCGYCGRSGHKKRDCEDYRELELGEKLPMDSPPGHHGLKTPERIQTLKPIQSRMESEIEADIEKEEPETESSFLEAILLGASMVKHISLSPIAAVVAESGVTAGEVDKLLNKAKECVEVEKIRNVLVHLGTNDTMSHSCDTESVKLNLAECVTKAQDFFPEARVAVSSILPRKGKSTSVQNYNQKAANVNQYLQRLAERDENLDYLDTVKSFTANNSVIKRLYSDSDQSGVHLSQAGQEVLRGIFLKHVQGTETRKRTRSKGSLSSVPPSAEKDPKKGRNNSQSS